VYDYLGRRVEKKVSTHNGTSWSVSDCRRFVWSDWLPVLELDASDPNDVTILRKYTWGLDLAGHNPSPERERGVSIDSGGGILDPIVTSRTGRRAAGVTRGRRLAVHLLGVILPRHG
jgi:hypothetical protein